MAPEAATSIDAVVVRVELFYRWDGGPGVVMWLADRNIATMMTRLPPDRQSLPEAIYEHVKHGAHVRLSGRWANVVFVDPMKPHAHQWPAPGRTFVIDQIELDGRPVEQRLHLNSLSWEIQQPWEIK